ncbi:phage head closure protein [Enterocloster bolteae]|jgi:SPP1 family predicted phage head-tail adaptor|uniref:phage head closure protein n=1 Tax=Enterocloster bolteae TaxID=208479 RepID=UPI0020675695|nr:phage head closure protein [Enterocloster bolteae]DAP19964.1 MAG TPA: Putative head tail adaptor [Caudoviricetes sp.]
MNAGAYRELVVIEKSGYAEDDIGNQIPSWTEYYRGYAYMNNLSGSEYWEAAQTQSQNTIMFVFRYHSLLGAMNTKEYRLVHRGKAYNITSIDNVQYKNETVKIRATAKE